LVDFLILLAQVDVPIVALPERLPEDGVSWWPAARPLIEWLLPLLATALFGAIAGFWGYWQKRRLDQQTKNFEVKLAEIQATSEFKREQLQNSLDQQKAVYDTLQEEISRMPKVLLDERTESRQLRQELRDARVELHESQKQLVGELSEARDRLESANKEIFEKEAQIVNLKSEIESLKARLRALESKPA